MKPLTNFLSIFISALAICLGPMQLEAADYFVDARIGSDSNQGSKTAPWQTIGRANTRLRAGDTVYIRAGKYQETIRPANSGAPGKYITYTAFNGEDVIIGGNITHGADLSTRIFVKIDGLTFTDTNKYWIQFWSSGSYHIVQNCTFEATGSTMGWAGVMIGAFAKYNKILNNTFESACYPSDLVDIYSGSYNLIEGNYFGNCAHTALAVQDRGPITEYNIIRNNTFENRYHHNIGLYKQPQHTLVEGNIIIDAGDDCDTQSCPKNTCGSDRDRAMNRENHSGLQNAAEYSIIRNNVLMNNGGFSIGAWSEDVTAVGNRIYHNTSYGNYYGFHANGDPNSPFSDNVLKNNIFINNKLYNYKFSATLNDTSSPVVNNFFHGAAPVTYKYKSGVETIQTVYTNEWDGNWALSSHDNPDIAFDNVDKGIFTLSSGSPLIEAGTWLTVITSSSGNGNTFTVADSKYFSDGFGVIPGDKIQIENQKSVIRVKSVDYITNKIVLESSISWNKGDGISLPYTGNKPDIGAFEYTSPDHLVPPKLFIVKQ